MITIDNLTIGYNKHPVIHHITAHINKGNAVAVVGPNGGGKTTFLKGIAGFLQPMEGSIKIAVPPKSIAYLPQHSTIDKAFPISAKELIATGLWHKAGWFKRYTKADLQQIDHAIHEVGLEGMEDMPLEALSGGQIQRALFARLILQNAQLILLDEPFNAVDYQTTQEMLNIVAKWTAEQRTIIAVLHNYDHVKNYFSQTLILARELIDYGNTATVLTTDNISQAFSTHTYPHKHANICHR